MKTNDTVGITFANTVLNYGVLNNVVNVNLGAYLFSPSANEDRVEFDQAVVCRLRMDVACATALRDALNKVLTPVAEANAGDAATQPKAH